MLTIKPGQCIIIYDDKRIYIKHIFDKHTFFPAPNQYFIGTEEEIDFKIFELGLPDIPFSINKAN